MPAALNLIAENIPRAAWTAFVLLLVALGVYGLHIQTQFGDLKLELAKVGVSMDRLRGDIDRARSDADAAVNNLRISLAQSDANMRDQRVYILRDFEQRIKTVSDKLEEVIEHLEATDARVERLRDHPRVQ